MNAPFLPFAEAELLPVAPPGWPFGELEPHAYDAIMIDPP